MCPTLQVWFSNIATYKTPLYHLPTTGKYISEHLFQSTYPQNTLGWPVWEIIKLIKNASSSRKNYNFSFTNFEVKTFCLFTPRTATCIHRANQLLLEGGEQERLLKGLTAWPPKHCWLWAQQKQKHQQGILVIEAFQLRTYSLHPNSFLKCSQLPSSNCSQHHARAYWRTRRLVLWSPSQAISSGSRFPWRLSLQDLTASSKNWLNAKFSFWR